MPEDTSTEIALPTPVEVPPDHSPVTGHGTGHTAEPALFPQNSELTDAIDALLASSTGADDKVTVEADVSVRHVLKQLARTRPLSGTAARKRKSRVKDKDTGLGRLDLKVPNEPATKEFLRSFAARVKTDAAVQVAEWVGVGPPPPGAATGTINLEQKARLEEVVYALRDVLSAILENRASVAATHRFAQSRDLARQIDLLDYDAEPLVVSDRELLTIIDMLRSKSDLATSVRQLCGKLASDPSLSACLNALTADEPTGSDVSAVLSMLRSVAPAHLNNACIGIGLDSILIKFWFQAAFSYKKEQQDCWRNFVEEFWPELLQLNALILVDPVLAPKFMSVIETVQQASRQQAAPETAEIAPSEKRGLMKRLAAGLGAWLPFRSRQ